MCIHHCYIPCPIQMLSLMYLIFSEKLRIACCDPLGVRVGNFFSHPDCIEFCESLGPPIPCLRETGFAEMSYMDLFQLFCVFLNGVNTGSIFFTNKIYRVFNLR